MTSPSDAPEITRDNPVLAGLAVAYPRRAHVLLDRWLAPRPGTSNLYALPPTEGRQPGACALCGGSGWQRFASWEDRNGRRLVPGRDDDSHGWWLERLRRCPCGLVETQHAAAQNARIAGCLPIPARYAGAALNSPRNGQEAAYGQAIDLLMSRLEAGQRKAAMAPMLIFGTYGSGKTHLAAALVREMAAHRFTTGFCAVPHIMEQIRRDFGGDAETARLAEDCDALALDDLGKVSGQWAEETLFRLIDQRYSRGLLTVVTVNDAALAMGNRDIAAAMKRRITENADSIRLPSPNGDRPASEPRMQQSPRG